MKKTISRMLALLLTLVILMGGMSTALASATQELGSIEDVEKLLFEAVLDVFPSSTLEQQYIYAAYYEKKGKPESVEALLATLTSEQLIAFMNYKAEQDCNCFDDAGNLVCEGAEACECLCHKVEAFADSMELLKAELLELDIDAALDHIYMLRQEELYQYFVEQGLAPAVKVYPFPTAGTNLDEYFANQTSKAAYAVKELEEGDDQTDEGDGQTIEVENQSTDAQQALEKLNLLQNAVDDKSQIGEDVNSALTDYTSTEGEFTALYTAKADYPNYVNQYARTSAAEQVVNAINKDIVALANENSTGFHALNDAAPDNILIELFNYNTEFLDKYSDRLGFFNGSYPYSVDKGDDSGNAGNKSIASKYYPGMKKTLRNDYPMTIKYGSMDYLFNNSVPVRHTINGNTGLFEKDSLGNYIYNSTYNAASFNGKNFTRYSNPVAPSYFYNGNTSYDNQEQVDDTEAGNFLPFNEYEGKTADGTLDKVVFYDMSDMGTFGRYKLSEEVDLWFGMYMQIDFYMPEGGYVKDDKGYEQPMIFEFSGDDDVYVFIDDVLVLDIGGTHGALDGSINFAEGKATWRRANESGGFEAAQTKTLRALFEEADTESKNDGLDGVSFAKFNTNGNTDTFADYTKHTLKFFYMDRGGTISHCSLKFNMPQLPAGALSVKKEISGDITETTNQAFTFEIRNKDKSLLTGEDANYVVTDAKGVTSEQKQAENGSFLIKAGETATFTNLPADKEYIISEVSNEVTSGIKWKIEDTKDDTLEEISNGEATVYIAPEQTATAMIVATNTLRTTSLTVDKKVVNPRPADANNVYTFEASICHGLEGKTPLTTVQYRQGENDIEPTTLTADGGKFIFTMKVTDDPITFIDLPIGATVTIKEVDTAASEGVKAVNVADFALTAEPISFAGGSKVDGHTFTGTMADVNGSTVTFTNTPKIYDLTITKNGLDMELDPHSSTMYSVVCADTGVNMTVAIYGNDFVKIKDLPVGTYTVTELTDWSWRYASSADKDEDENTEGYQVILDGTGDEITFTNTRVYDKWLDSDCYAENTFDGTPSDDRRPKQ